MNVRTKRLGVLLGVLALLTTSTASADHSNFFEITNFSPNTTDANADVTAKTTTPANRHAAEITVHLAPGFLVAHENPSTSLITPVPNKDEQVGSGKVTARFQALFCAQTTVNGTAYMDELLGQQNDPNEPDDAVARYRIEPDVSFLSDLFAYVVDDPQGHYSIVLNDLPGGTCSSFSASTELTVLGETASGNKIWQNPDTAGFYDICVEYIDRSSNPHDDCDEVEVVDP